MAPQNTQPKITKLDHQDLGTADKIHALLQSSYRVEATLIGVTDFPPLKRTIANVHNATTEFWGWSEENRLAGVVEIIATDTQVEICSLVVDPKSFRMGVASRLLRHVLGSITKGRIMVETAVANSPAIALYQKHGFSEEKRWHTAQGIEKLSFSLDVACLHQAHEPN